MRARVARDALTPASALAALALLLAVFGCSSRSGNPARVATGYISCGSGSGAAGVRGWLLCRLRSESESPTEGW